MVVNQLPIAIGSTKDWGTGALWLAAMYHGIVVKYHHDKKPAIDQYAAWMWSLKATSIEGGRVIYDSNGDISLNQEESRAFGTFPYDKYDLPAPPKKQNLAGAKTALR